METGAAGQPKFHRRRCCCCKPGRLSSTPPTTVASRALLQTMPDSPRSRLPFLHLPPSAGSRHGNANPPRRLRLSTAGSRAPVLQAAPASAFSQAGHALLLAGTVAAEVRRLPAPAHGRHRPVRQIRQSSAAGRRQTSTAAGQCPAAGRFPPLVVLEVADIRSNVADVRSGSGVLRRGNRSSGRDVRVETSRSEFGRIGVAANSASVAACQRPSRRLHLDGDYSGGAAKEREGGEPA